MKLKVGVIGAGSMGINHVRVLSHMQEASLVGVADIDDKALKKIHKIYEVPVFKNIEELLNQDIDAVTIAVPTSLHRNIALLVIKHGLHLLVEKPIAGNIPDAEEIIAAADKNGVKLMVGHIERFNPIIPTIRNAISGERIISIDITRVGPYPPRIKDVGVIIDLGVHDIDLICFLTNSDFVDIDCHISNNFTEFEDTAMLTFRMSNGTLAHVTTNWITPFKRRMIQIATPDKFIEGNFITMQAIEYSGFRENHGSHVVSPLRTQIGEPLKLELKAFIDSVSNNIELPITGEDGLKALTIATECLKIGHNSYFTDIKQRNLV
ncbi:gfo/Idh/MocA family oxidoreductase [Candidatus Poribacteria bacterium]|nr:gfo/Idh/MocA family oxidoreductase [Candidatus Poribacteria bacterium]